MRQLFLVLIVFLLSLFTLVALFNTVTNTSKQSNIVLATTLPDYPEAEENLTQALRWRSSDDSIGQAQIKDFYAWIRLQYPLLFDNPNLEWQEFGASNWVAKWVGRQADLAPIVWMASPQVTMPTAAERRNWSVTPFAGELTAEHIYGQGSQGSKAAMIAMLEVLQQLIAQERLPDRTIYLAFPFPAQIGEARILKALAQAGTPAEYVLKTGGWVAQNLLWELSAPVALLGVGQLAQADLTLVRKHPKVAWSGVLDRLQAQLPKADLTHNTTRELLQQLSPELPFKQRFIFSNTWLLGWNQDSYFSPNSLPNSLVGTQARLFPSLPDSDTTQLRITAPSLDQATLLSIQTLVKLDSVKVIDNWKWQQGYATADLESRSYRLLGNTCKEVFPNLITAPIWVDQPAAPATKAIKAPIFYFQPVVYEADSWQKAQLGVTERISRQNYQRLLHFYHQLLSNSI